MDPSIYFDHAGKAWKIDLTLSEYADLSAALRREVIENPQELATRFLNHELRAELISCLSFDTEGMGGSVDEGLSTFLASLDGLSAFTSLVSALAQAHHEDTDFLAALERLETMVMGSGDGDDEPAPGQELDQDTDQSGEASDVGAGGQVEMHMTAVDSVRFDFADSADPKAGGNVDLQE